MPLISVIIPTYNRERFVVKAIDSVLGQTFAGFEIIVIDDGSTDGTRKTLEAYGNKIMYIFQENSGVSSARNTGIRAAQSEWLAFLDSDDEWRKDYLSTQVEYIENFPTAVAHITNGVIIVDHEMRISGFVETGFLNRFKTKPYLIVEEPLCVLLSHQPWLFPSIIIRRDILLKAGLFDEGLSIAEDLDVIARVALRGPFTFSRKELVEVYRRKELIENLAALSLKRGIHKYTSFARVYANLLNAPGLTPEERTVLTRALSSTKRALGNALVMAGRKAEARQAYQESFSLCPSVKSLAKFSATYFPGILSRLLVRCKHILPGEEPQKKPTAE